MGSVRTRRQVVLQTALVIAGIAALVTVVIFVPTGMRSWLGAVLAAGMAAYLGRDFPRFTAAVSTWVKNRGVPTPLTVTVKILDEDYVVHTEADRVVEVPASGHTVRLVVEAAEDVSAVLTGLRPEVTARKDRRGDLVRHAGEVPLRRFEVLLDDKPPRVRALEGSGVFPFRVAPNDPEVFELEVRTESDDVSWILHLEWVCAGKAGTTRVDLDGKPFRTVARHPQVSRDPA